jgi:N-acyl-D-aspartate/D-glutamate deacylase
VRRSAQKKGALGRGDRPLARRLDDQGPRAHPRKGTIAIGSDADLVIWDPDQEWTIANAGLHHNVDYTPYEGVRVKGRPELTLSRGAVVMRGGAMVGEPGQGMFLPCDLPALAADHPQVSVLT